MNYALVFRPEVREELNEAYSWYESQQPGLGDEFLDTIAINQYSGIIMEELLALKSLLLQGDIPEALLIIEELEEMSRDDKINNIRSYAKILLRHLIKQQAENRTTRSWDVSIRNSAREIQEKNKRHKAGGYYLNAEELREVLSAAYPMAADKASLEVAEGRYETAELENMVNREEILNRALALISPEV